jgi:hypothetical protein
MLGFCATVTVSLMAAGVVLGFSNTTAYILDFPGFRAPSDLVTQSNRPSLTSALLRAGVAPSMVSWQIGLTVVLVCLVTAWALGRSADDEAALAIVGRSWLLAMVTGLVLYPGTLDHYSVFLVPAVFAIVAQAAHRERGYDASLPIVAAVAGVAFALAVQASLLVVLIVGWLGLLFLTRAAAWLPPRGST